MRKMGIVVGVAVLVGVLAGMASAETFTRDDLKSGSIHQRGFVTKLNSLGETNLVVTNVSVTAQTATKAGTVTPQTATVTVTLTPQTCLATNSAGAEVAVWTNCTASFTGLTNVTVSVAAVATNVATTVQRR